MYESALFKNKTCNVDVIKTYKSRGKSLKEIFS